MRKIRNILFILVLVTAGTFCGYRFAGKNISDVKNKINNDLESPDIEIMKVKADPKELEELYKGYNYDKVISKYNDKLDKDFTVTRFKYFAVFSDLAPELTYNLINNDIRNITASMENNYVKKKPKGVTAVFLFQDFGPYKDFAISNFNVPEYDLSPYGFYKTQENVILVRYLSWKGSLPHEISHVFLNEDFPGIPGWFNEGFASLHEKTMFIKGEAVGLYNWRINTIRKAFHEGSYSGLRTMTGVSDDVLYGTTGPVYYAESMYLQKYLQEKDLLKEYYNLYRNTYSRDNSGISQLEKILGEPMEQIETDYIEYIKSFKD
jgi:hypothetical protein